MSKKLILEKGDRILAVSESNPKDIKQFGINRNLGGEGGGCAVSYSASFGKEGQTVFGVLKEFYPEELKDYLERDPESQLICRSIGSVREKLEKREEAYLSSYRRIKQAMASLQSGPLQTFLPNFEIFHGCDREGNRIGTAYIWTPAAESTTFETMCGSVRSNPKRESEYRLLEILKAIYSLTECVCELHTVGLIHRDIKPGNFGFPQRNRILTDTPMLFDVDSICPLDDVRNRVVSEHFTRPDCLRGATDRPDFTRFLRDDIYSIGATLFYAVIIRKTEKDESDKTVSRYRSVYYEPAFHPDIRKMVNESELINATESTSHFQLKALLVKILKKSLAAERSPGYCEDEYRERYESCEELMKDLRQAILQLYPAELLRDTSPDECDFSSDAGSYLDRFPKRNSTLTFLLHLYEHPLYRRCAEKEPAEITVLLLGFGHYGQKFLDACLQVVQNLTLRFHFHVVSKDPEHKRIYLAERPELKRFYAIDGIYDAKDGEPFGRITFETAEIGVGGGEGDRNDPVIRNILKKENVRNFRYLFIALGNDRDNRTAAELFSRAGEENPPSGIHYVQEKTTGDSPEGPGLFPVYINHPFSERKRFREIRELAFNVHLSWEGDLNSDPKNQARFRKKYYLESCISFVLSIRYKLFDAGIDPDTLSLRDAAKLFAEKLADPVYENRAAQNEHRRWIMEKVCDGWSPLEWDFEAQRERIRTKDKEQKKHICLVRSGENAPDLTPYWENPDRVTDDLDPLDRVSVRLHRAYSERAVRIGRAGLSSNGSVAELRRISLADEKMFFALQELLNYLHDMLAKCASAERSGTGNGFCGIDPGLYEELTQNLLDSIRNSRLDAEETDCAEKSVHALRAYMEPVYNSFLRTDYKQTDKRMIRWIPFILTYSQQMNLVVPYLSETAEEIVGNIALTSVLHPSSILYLYRIRKPEDASGLRKTLPGILEFLSRKRLHAKVDFLISWELSEKGGMDALRQWISERVRSVRMLPAAPGDLGVFRDAFRQFPALLRKKGNALLIDRGSELSDFLRKEKSLASVGVCSFDHVREKLLCIRNTEYLQYIPIKASVTVADLLALAGARIVSDRRADFFGEYGRLWRLYQKNPDLWKNLCREIGHRSEEADRITSFPLLSDPTGKKRTELCFPSGCLSAVKDLIRQLAKQGIISEDEPEILYTGDRCRTVLSVLYRTEDDLKEREKRLYRLFRDPFRLSGGQSPRVERTETELLVSSSSLRVENVRADGEARSLLEELQEKGYLIALEDDSPDGSPGSVSVMSFTFSSEAVKELLTDEARLLEIGLCCKAKEERYFSDVFADCTIKTDGNDLPFHVDCVLLKGFCLLFAEFQTSEKLDPEFCRAFSENAKACGAGWILFSEYEHDLRSAGNPCEEEIRTIPTVCIGSRIERMGDILKEVFEKERESGRDSDIQKGKKECSHV